MKLMLYLSYISLISCTVSTDLYQKLSTTMHYRAVKGEMFMMPCKSWSRVEPHKKDNHPRPETSFAQFKAEAADSGNYTCHTSRHHGDCSSLALNASVSMETSTPCYWSDLWRVVPAHSSNASFSSAGLQFLHLQVVNNTMGCLKAEESSVTLQTGVGGQIPCPGLNCSKSTTAVWYKGNRTVSELRRGKDFFSNGTLHLRSVMRIDSAVFFCDRELSDRGVNWTIRRSVTVKALNPKKAVPRFESPENNTEQEVELGSSHTLKCVVYFPEADPPGVIQWIRNDSGHLVNLKTEKIEDKKGWEIQVIGTVIIEQVTAQDLNKMYMCITQNTSGNNSITINLKENKLQWSSMIEYSLAPLLFVTGLVIVVRVKWMEIQLILKSRLAFRKQDTSHKDFDVFLSFVWTTSSTELLSSPLRHNNHDGTFSFSLDPLEVEVPSERLELLLPHVLEDQWGYRICLMDRDFLPGGGYSMREIAKKLKISYNGVYYSLQRTFSDPKLLNVYTKDVANAIQRSQILICLLSAEYLSDNNAVFVLESGVQALLQNSAIKLLLIWTSRPPVSFHQLDPQLPVMIQKALKVLPTLKWMSASNSHFWMHLKDAMPHKRVLSLQE